jgi:D-alanyl-D-alanine carboxypeptidase/D-alanyl-D-alanine-endopeptidase (penicillin-binding protein 4)
LRWRDRALAVRRLRASAALPRDVSRAFSTRSAAQRRAQSCAGRVQEQGRSSRTSRTAVQPGSVMKLVTTFAALELLGPDYSWKTFAYLDGPLDGAACCTATSC